MICHPMNYHFFVAKKKKIKLISKNNFIKIKKVPNQKKRRKK